MADRAAGLVASYVELAHAIAQHAPDTIDAYYGPRAWAQVGGGALSELDGKADTLAERVADLEDGERRVYLTGQVRAMRTTLDLLMGRDVPFRAEVESLYDVVPERVPEARLAELRQRLAELVPGEGDVAQRLERLAAAERVAGEGARPVLDAVLTELRKRTKTLFPLPEEEEVELRLVRDKPWAGYNTYQGDYTSRVEINIDLPLQLHTLPSMLAHEAYPGHHTEQAIKERLLVGERGWLEHTLQLIYAPASTVGEGIAESASEVVFGRDELRAWLAEELAPLASVDAEAAVRAHDTAQARESLRRSVTANAALMLSEEGASGDAVVAYVQQQGLVTRQEAEQTLRFLSVPRLSSYAFTYAGGRALLERLFALGDPAAWFARLLTEPVTPGTIRQWIAAAERAARAGPGRGDEQGAAGRGPSEPAPAERPPAAAGGERVGLAPAVTPSGAAAPQPARAAGSPAASPPRQPGTARAASTPGSAAPRQAPAPSATRARPPLRDLTPVLADLEVELGGTLGVAARALAGDGAEAEAAVAYRVDEPFPAASTIKVFVLQTLLERVAAGTLRLDEELVLGSSDRVLGSGVLKALTPGRSYTLRDLATLMIVVSDNTATNMLIQRLGVQAVNDVVAAHGWTATNLVGLLQRPDLRAAGDDRVSTTSPGDLADYFRRLWAGELLPPEPGEVARGIFRSQQLTQQLGRYLPYDPDSSEEGEGPVIASKSGSIRGVRNDAGVIEVGGAAYVLAIMSRDCPDGRFHLDNRGSLVVSKVSRLLYQRYAAR